MHYRGDRRCDLSSRRTIRSRFVIEEESRDVNKEKNNNKLNILKENNEQKKTRYQLFSLDKLIELHGFFLMMSSMNAGCYARAFCFVLFVALIQLSSTLLALALR